MLDTGAGETLLIPTTGVCIINAKQKVLTAPLSFHFWVFYFYLNSLLRTEKVGTEEAVNYNQPCWELELSPVQRGV